MATPAPTPRLEGPTTSRSRRRPRRKAWSLAGLVLLLVALLVLTGCIKILSLTLPTNVEAGTHYTITVRVQPNADQTGDGRMVFAVRIPNQWTVTSVTYDGAVTGAFTSSNTIATYFGTDWEAKAVDAKHNGPKPGYKWWAGYSANLSGLLATEWADITVVVNTNGSSGPFALDFATGLATQANPTDKAANGNGANWEIGEARLDQALTLLPMVRPFVVSTSPAAGSVNVDRSVSPTVTFSEPVSTAGLGAKVFVRKMGGAPLAAGSSYNPATNTLEIDPNADLEGSTAYQIVVLQTVVDLAGNSMAADYVVGFTTEAAPVAPQVTGKLPIPGSTGVAVDAVVVATFDQDMDGSTVTSAYYYITSAASPTAIPATVTYVGPARQAVIDPTANLEYETEYTVSLRSGVKGANGLSVQGAPVIWSFTTAAAPPSGPTFVDVPASSPFYDAVEGLADRGIVAGYDIGGGMLQFRPNNAVWRAQFAKMIVGALGLPVSEAMPLAPFTDLGADNPGDLYPHEYVAAAYANGITNGTSPTTFGPYLEIGRTQVVTMVTRAVQNIAPGTLGTPPPGYANSWGTGYSSIHGPLARIAEYNGLLSGVDLAGVASDPWSPMPRGEVAQIVWNMMGLMSLR